MDSVCNPTQTHDAKTDPSRHAASLTRDHGIEPRFGRYWHLLLTIIVIGETAGAWGSLGLPLLHIRPRPGANLQAQRLEGVLQSATPLAAVVSPNYYPSPQWLEEALQSDVDVTAGCIAPAPTLSWFGWAVYFTEYSHVAPPMREGRMEPQEAWLTPGGNVIYRKAAVSLDALHPADRELDFHRRIAAQGIRFARRPQMIAHFQNVQSVREYCSERWHFSSALGRAGFAQGASWRQIGILAALPILIPARVVWNIGRKGRYLGRLVLALPLIILIGLLQTLGELHGALRFGKP